MPQVIRPDPAESDEKRLPHPVILPPPSEQRCRLLQLDATNLQRDAEGPELALLLGNGWRVESSFPWNDGRRDWVCLLLAPPSLGRASAGPGISRGWFLAAFALLMFVAGALVVLAAVLLSAGSQ